MTVEETQKNDEWPDDVFKRKKYATFLTELLVKKKEPFILNINAEWGTGKTFFLTNWKEDIEDTHPTVYFNAWKKDFVKDPLPAVISEINKRLLQLSPKLGSDESTFKKKTFITLKAVAPMLVKSIVKKYIGQDGVNEIEGLFTASKEDETSIAEIASKVTESILVPFEKEEASIDEFKKTLSDLLQYLAEKTSYELPMFIFVDELDRCRPLFAIETLEKAKHLFDIPEIKFVIATDTEQLSHSVKAIYGEGFGARMYLRRFFSQEFSLPYPDYLDFAINLFRTFQCDCSLVEYRINIAHPYRNDSTNIVKTGAKLSGINHIESIVLFALFSDLFGLDLRTQQQCYERLLAIVLTSDVTENLHLGYLIFLIMLKERQPEIYSSFFSNHSSTIRMDKLRDELPNSKTIIELCNPRSQNVHEYMEITAQVLALQYTGSLDKNRDNILKEVNTHTTATGVLVNKIHSDYSSLHQYNDRVDLVGRLL